MAAIEAQACGVPVICSDTSSLPEVGGEAAIYFSPLDHETLASHMKMVTENKPLADELRIKGLAQASSFAPEQYTARMMQIYEKLL